MDYEPLTLSECIDALNGIKSTINSVIELFRLASKDGDPDKFEGNELEKLAYGTLKLVPTNEQQIQQRKRNTKPKKDLSNKLIRTAQAAELLGISRQSLYKWRKKPGFPKMYKLSSRASGFREDDLRAWIEQNEEILA